MKQLLLFILLISTIFANDSTTTTRKATAKEIKQFIIKSSISNYSGNCPCPYNRASNGSKCGKRSAWSRPGGADPICYESDISPELLTFWKEKIFEQ